MNDNRHIYCRCEWREEKQTKQCAWGGGGDGLSGGGEVGGGWTEGVLNVETLGASVIS